MKYNQLNISLLVACGIINISYAQDKVKKNVLFICVDDLRNELGCLGGQAITPNLDDFSKISTRFENHYVQVPTSGASRASMLTGELPRNYNDVTNSAVIHKMARKNIKTESIFHLLKQSGYNTIGIGKISHSADGYIMSEGNRVPEMPRSWSEIIFNHGKWRDADASFFGYSDGEDRNFLNKRVKPYECGNVDDDGYVDALTSQLAIEKIKQLANKEEAFCLAVGFFKPHLPFNSPKKYWDMYEREDINLSEYNFLPKNSSMQGLTNSSEFNQYALGDEFPTLKKPISDEYARKITHAYLACVSYVDAQIGAVLKALEDNNLMENTLVVIWGDHGWHLGDQLIWGKHTILDKALKSTLMIYNPEVSKENLCKEIVSSVDLYPTLADWCGIDITGDEKDGQSILNLTIKNQKRDGKHSVAYSFYNGGVSMRNKRYRLTKYQSKKGVEWELYDYKKAPQEQINIYDKKQKVVEKMMPLFVLQNPK